jgi:hypothetical protein
MTRWLGAALAMTLLSGPARADENDAQGVVDKAIKALGGEDKLGKVTAWTTKAKGTLTIQGNDNSFSTESTMQGIDRVRGVFEGDFNGQNIRFVTVIDKDKGWRTAGDQTMPIEDEFLTNEKRRLYLRNVPILPTLLKEKGFKLISTSEEKVEGKPAVGVKGTGPDGKDFTIYFDKESGLPVKVAATVPGFMGDEAAEESFFSDYKDFGGIKHATKVEVKRDGTTLLKQEITDFKVLDKVDADTFAEPK